MKFSNEMIHEYLMNMLQEGEDYKYPIYAGFGSGRYDKRYGYLSVTNYNNLLMAQFTVIGTLLVRAALPLKSMTSLKISKVPLTKIISAKLRFNINGEKVDLKFIANPKVFMTDLNDQEQNLPGLLDELRKWCIDK